MHLLDCDVINGALRATASPTPASSGSICRPALRRRRPPHTAAAPGERNDRALAAQDSQVEGGRVARPLDTNGLRAGARELLVTQKGPELARRAALAIRGESLEMEFPNRDWLLLQFEKSRIDCVIALKPNP